jgi:hypothetical protein
MPKLPTARTKAPAEHAFAGASAAYGELLRVDAASGLTTYRTRCGIYVVKERLCGPRRSQRPVPCPACQAAREETP